MTLNVQEAVQKAKAALQELYSDDKPEQLALEEIEQVTEGKRELWAVTLGFYRRKSVTALQSGGLLGPFVSAQPQHVEQRVYKTIYLDAESGEFVKMEMRQA